MAESTPPPSADAAKKVSRDAGALVIGNAMSTLADIVVPLVVVRLIGKAEVGSLMALLLVYNTVALVLTAGLPHTLTFFLPGRELDDRAAIARRVLWFMGMLGAAAGVALAGVGTVGASWAAIIPGAQDVAKADLSPLMFLCLFAPFDIPARAIPTWMVAEGRAGAAARFGVMRSIGVNVCTLVPLAFGFGAHEVAMALVGLGLAELIYIRVHYRQCYRAAKRIPSPVTTREVLRFGIPLGMTDIVSLLGNKLDAFLILVYFTATSFAEYTAGSWKIPFVTTIPRFVGTALAPRMVEHFKAAEPRAALDLWRASVIKVSLLVVPVTMVFVVAAEDAVRFLFTDAYGRAAAILRWYALLSMGRVAAFGTVIVATGRSHYVLRASAFTLATNVVISVPLVYLVGFEGPAMGTFIAFIPSAIYYCICIGRAAGLPAHGIFPLGPYLRTLAIAGVGGVAALVLRPLLSVGPAAGLGITAALVIVPFIALAHLLGMLTRDDWRELAGYLRPSRAR